MLSLKAFLKSSFVSSLKILKLLNIINEFSKAKNSPLYEVKALLENIFQALISLCSVCVNQHYFLKFFFYKSWA